MDDNVAEQYNNPHFPARRTPARAEESNRKPVNQV